MSRPPPALDCARVLEYAIADESVTFEQRYTLNVDGEWVGRVPKLAICQNLDEPEFLVFHCTDEWDVIGVAAGYKTAEEAKRRLERSYHGLATKWQVAGYAPGEAEAYIAEQFKGHECSFCGRLPLQFQQSIAGESVRICNRCVDDFYERMHSETSEP